MQSYIKPTMFSHSIAPSIFGSTTNANVNANNTTNGINVFGKPSIFGATTNNDVKSSSLFRPANSVFSPSLFNTTTTQSLSGPIFSTSHTIKTSEDKGTSTRMELPTVPFSNISADKLLTKTIGMFTVGTVGSMSRNHNELVEETIALAEHLLDGNSSSTKKWKLTSILPLALYNLDSNVLKETLENLMGKSKLANDVAFVYVKLIQNLIIEKLNSVDEIYDFIMTTAQALNNKRLYITAKLFSMYKEHNINIAEELFGKNRDMNDDIQNFMVAVHSFVTYENEPVKVMVLETSKTDQDSMHTIKLVGELCGASYGCAWLPSEWTSNNDLLNRVVELSKKLALVSGA